MAPAARQGAFRGRSGRRRLLGAALISMVLVSIVWPGGASADDPTAPSGSSVSPTPSVTSGPRDPSSTTEPGAVSTTVAGPPVTAGPGGFGAPGGFDPTAPPEPPMPDPSPQVKVLLDQLVAQQDEKVIREFDADTAVFQAREAAADRRLTEALERQSRAIQAFRTTERTLRDDALARYVSPVASRLPAIVATQDNDVRTRIVLADVTIDEHIQDRARALEHVAEAKRVVGRRKDELAVATRATQAARDRATAKSAELAQQNKELDASRGPGGNWSLPIEGSSVFTAAELAEWFVSRGIPSHAQTSITQLAAAYVIEGNQQKIRGDMAFAQSILETGSFSNPDTIALNNFAGVGHCDTCASGFAFATPLLGVRAQIQLLADYAQRNVVLVHPLVDRRLHGPSGCCQTWGQLTHTWATNGNYGPKIMGVYREMLWWLVVHRGLTPQVGPR